jgi:transposase
MGKSPELSSETRKTLVQLKREGLSDRKVGLKLNISKSAVNTVWNRYKKTGKADALKHTGRKPKISKRLTRRLVRYVTQNPFDSSRKITETLNFGRLSSLHVTSSRVRQILVKNGLKARRRPKKWLISKKNQIIRVKWCKIMKNLHSSDWEKVIFSDECMVSGGVSSYFARSRNCLHLNNELSIKQSNYGPKVHIWGAICVDGTFALEFLDENVTSTTYLELLERRLQPVMTELRQKTLLFQQDNARPHTAKKLTNFFIKNNIIKIPWPAQSPDLNIIENVWNQMKKTMKSSYETQLELRHDLQEAWSSIDSSFIKKLYDSIPRRLEAVIKAKGQSTKY